jgi:protein-S-isoprenylcysteine O-methyltransferase Ste14
MNLRLRVPPLAWLPIFGALMWGLHRAAPISQFIVRPMSRAGWLLAALGLSLAASAVLHFRRVRTTVNPLTPAKASSLVTSGIFGYSRNPMYLGMLLVLAGWAIVLGSLGPWLALPLFVVVMTKMQIEPEEAVLSVLFGGQYRDYCARVGRWLGRKG